MSNIDVFCRNAQIHEQKKMKTIHKLYYRYVEAHSYICVVQYEYYTQPLECVSATKKIENAHFCVYYIAHSTYKVISNEKKNQE